MENDSRSRKWQITINNPVEKGYSHDRIKELLGLFDSMLYSCMSDEVGENGTYHTHIYIALKDASRFSTLKSRFDGAHFEMAKGTSQQNRDYIFKEGKWLSERKRETNLIDTHEEYGQMPVERPGARTDLADLYDMIRQGMTDSDILDESPQYLFNLEKIEHARQVVRQSIYRDKFRELEVVYIFGDTGLGKTRDVMEKYGYSNVYRVTDYLHPFDGYKGQDVLIFEEFRSSLSIQDMLNLLDGYPLDLPCRYSNKTACYTKVFIITNIPLEDQYTGIQREHTATWEALKRRIHKIVRYTLFGIDRYESLQDYFNRFIEFQEKMDIFG